MESNQIKKGRPIGSQNKVSLTLKTRINLFVDKNFDGLQSEYDQLESKDKLSFITALMPYLMPKLSAVAADVHVSQRLQGLTDQELDSLIDTVLNTVDDE